MRRFCALVLSSTVCAHAFAADDKPPYSAGIANPATTSVYWGDTHLHSRESADAYNLGNRLTREDAYRFARGEAVVSSSDIPVRLTRPLDFLVVSDHAEFLGIFNMLEPARRALRVVRPRQALAEPDR